MIDRGCAMAASNSEEPLRVGFATVKEAAAYLAVSRQYLYRLVQENRIPSSRIGSQRRVAWSWLYDQERIAAGKTPENAEVSQ